jgi:co-chaperonin GroES (HSP10)
MTKINYTPIGKSIVVEIPKTEVETKSGIIKSEAMIKEEQESRSGHAKVVAVGSEITEIKVGDIVIPKGQGFEINVDDVKYFQTDIYNILGIVG